MKFLSILESRRHKLLNAYDLTFVIHSLFGWEAFSTPLALTYTRISWALSPMTSQVPGVIPGPRLCIAHGEVRDKVSIDEMISSSDDFVGLACI